MTIDEELRWYALHVKPNHEELTSTLLSFKGYETYVPEYRTETKRRGRVKNTKRLFPGYVFCRFCPNSCGQTGAGAGVVTTSGVLRIVGAGDVAISIPDSEIEAIQRILESNLAAEPWTYLRAGQKIQISAGPLRGLTGLLVSIERADRLLVSINVLQRSLAVSIRHDWVNPLTVLSQVFAERGSPDLVSEPSTLRTPAHVSHAA